MSKRKNAGEGYGYQFHGAFTKKADAVKKERTRKGSFIKGIPTQKGYRYVVFTPRTNPRRRRNLAGDKYPREVLNTGDYRAQEISRGRFKVYTHGGVSPTLKSKRQVMRWIDSDRSHAGRAHHQGNPMDLLVMGANPGRNSSEITVQPGQVITLRVNPVGVNPSGEICGHMVQGYPCTREPGHAGPHLPQGATLRPASRHNWGRSNPSAETLRETFTGTPADFISVHDEPLMPAGDYALLGKLLALYVRPLAGGQILQINGRGVLVVADETARQIWFVGGDQDVSQFLDKFGAVDIAAPAGYYELGEAVRIDYKQRKEHVPKPELDEWKHYFGHENHVKPGVYFDVNHKRLMLEGGDYRVEERGIIN